MLPEKNEKIQIRAGSEEFWENFCAQTGVSKDNLEFKQSQAHQEQPSSQVIGGNCFEEIQAFDGDWRKYPALAKIINETLKT